MAIRISIGGVTKEIKPTSGWNSIDIDSENAEIKTDPKYYIAVLNIMGR
jgi:hypothetical protein